MAEESKGGLWVGALAVIGIGVAGYIIYLNSRSPADNVPPLNMSREELMSKAMIDGPGADDAAKSDPNTPKTASLKKGSSTP